ncbi:ROK family transcriptional regulator [Streptomyces hoynatensis]|uniref:ROK family transcriptional regulator n=1 Tax=Streptomyces hoynatensis TaxID=1141874 RepID=A0A3A9Z9E0_9ACTN|nr:ROK family transcriptional regulator [Streptomyces hoynatensis]RKN44868.1 ROK family transcriptional regulator [Streptomyces hoynatensis]
MGGLAGGEPSLLRRINSAAVLRALRDAGPSLSLSDLAREVGLSRPTVEGVLEGLARAGLVAETGSAGPAGERRPGRPARRFRFRAEAGLVLGAEVGARRVSAILADLGGARLGGAAREVPTGADADERLDQLAEVAAGLLRESGAEPGALRAVGVGSPGIVGQDGTVRLCTALPGWTGLPLAARLRARFGCEVLVENDANAAVLGERWSGAAAGSQDVVMVLAGLSPGAGSLIGGRLHRGFGGAAGEIGALHLLGRQAAPERLLAISGEPLEPLDEQAVAAVFARARAGEPPAADAVRRFVQRLVHDVTALVLALDPELVVIGGWAAGLDGVVEPLRGELARYCLRTPRVVASTLGEAAVATGALRLALDRVEEELFAVEGRVTPR